MKQLPLPVLKEYILPDVGDGPWGSQAQPPRPAPPKPGTPGLRTPASHGGAMAAQQGWHGTCQPVAQLWHRENGAFTQLWWGCTDPHFQMVMEHWVHCAEMSCGGNTFPSLRCWTGCQIPGFEEPSQCPLQLVLWLAWRSLRSTGRKVYQASLAAQWSFELAYIPLLPRRL